MLGIASLLLTLGLVSAMEILWRRGDMAIADRARGLAIWAIMAPWWILVGSFAPDLFQALGIRPLVSLSLGVGWSTWLAIPLATALAFLWADFWFYWFHRAQHRFLWRFHAVHHSIENLSAVNSYHHWTEPFVWIALITLPMTLIDIGFYPRAAALTFFFTLQPAFIHSATRLNFGPLGRLLIDNRFHRIHHSIEERHFDKNFGAMTPLWDWLFGTIHMPAPGEWPETGLSSTREPRNPIEWAILPWQRRLIVDDLAPARARGH